MDDGDCKNVAPASMAVSLKMWGSRPIPGRPEPGRGLLEFLNTACRKAWGSCWGIETAPCRMGALLPEGRGAGQPHSNLKQETGNNILA